MDILCKGSCELGQEMYNCHPSTLETEARALHVLEQSLENPKQHLKTQKQTKPTTARASTHE